MTLRVRGRYGQDFVEGIRRPIRIKRAAKGKASVIGGVSFSLASLRALHLAFLKSARAQNFGGQRSDAWRA
jgi:hypothetical protein